MNELKKKGDGKDKEPQETKHDKQSDDRLSTPSFYALAAGVVVIGVIIGQVAFPLLAPVK